MEEGPGCGGCYALTGKSRRQTLVTNKHLSRSGSGFWMMPVGLILLTQRRVLGSRFSPSAVQGVGVYPKKVLQQLRELVTEERRCLLLMNR